MPFSFETFLQYCWPVAAVLIGAVLVQAFCSSRVTTREFGWVAAATLTVCVLVLIGMGISDDVSAGVLAYDGLLVMVLAALALVLILMEMGWLPTPFEEKHLIEANKELRARQSRSH